MTNDDQLAAPTPDTVSRRLGDSIVLVNLRTNRIYELNRTAARFWELLNQKRIRSEIAKVMSSEFDAPLERVQREIDALVAELVEEELVRVGAGG